MLASETFDNFNLCDVLSIRRHLYILLQMTLPSNIGRGQLKTLCCGRTALHYKVSPRIIIRPAEDAKADF